MEQDEVSPPAAKKQKVANSCALERIGVMEEPVCKIADESKDKVPVCIQIDKPQATGDNENIPVCIQTDKRQAVGDSEEVPVCVQTDKPQATGDIENIPICVQIDKSQADGDSNQNSQTDKTSVVKLATESRICEKDVGMEEYISSYPGFQAVIKQRYSDFLVNEISKDGRQIELTNTDLPSAVPNPNIEIGIDSVVSELISEEDIGKLKELVKSNDTRQSVLIVVGEDKSKRARIHCAIEKGFPGLHSSTVTKAEQRYIEVRITDNRGNGLRQWPKGRGDYCKFVLYKEAKDTMDAVGLLSSKMRLKSGLFQYAGTKDKRAKTSQEVTAFRVAAEKLKEANKKLRNIVSGNYSYCSQKLKLGQLKGNKFTIVLRSVRGTEEQIEAGMGSLRDVGFINYYGMQRFGVYTIPTHHIGRALLSGNWKEAVELILKPRSGEDTNSTGAREMWWKTRDSKTAISKFPKSAYIERNVLLALSTGGDNDYLGAINKIARNTRLMYVHAYQSYVWNTVVSHRVRKHGLQPVCGDLVIPHKSFIQTEDMEDELSEEKTNKVSPTILDSSNIGDYTVYDVVLPKPGYDVTYPTNDTEELYKELLVKDGLDYKNMRSKHKDFSLSGDYRHIVVQPSDVAWRLFRYSDVNVPLALSDWDRINHEPEPQSVEGGAQLALRLELALPSSCYATMALRELMKIDTSSSYQTTLNT